MSLDMKADKLSSREEVTYKYEVDYRSIEDDDIHLINQRGSYGWRLVSVVVIDTEITYYWESPVEPRPL
jgi:hypothetical protein